MTVSLRPYQTHALDAVRAAFNAGRRAPILVSPTGSGKTVMASSVISGATAKGRRVLFLAHRFELVEQAAMKLASYGITHAVVAPTASQRQIMVRQFRELGRSYVDARALVSVGTVQTQSRRLEKVIAPPDLIIMDECHLSIAPSYLAVVEAFPRARLLGLTATPTRLDGKGLGRDAGGLYDDMVVLCQPSMLLDQGFLVPMRFFGAPQQLDLSGVRTVRGDYDQQQVAELVDKPKLIGDALEHWQRIAKGRPTIAFCASIQHAEDVAEQFRAAGFKARAVSGETDASERQAAVAALGRGEIDVLCNCALYIEGLDQPAISCVMLLTPTQSLTRYLQAVGRGARPAPGKHDCIVLDHAGNIYRHGHPYDAREWTLDGQQKGRRKAANDNEDGVDRVSTCKRCFTIHLPAPTCPTCGFEYPVRARRLEQQDGELQEITADQLDAMRRARRALQGSAQTVDELVHKAGMSRPRAQKIVAAREAKAAQVAAIMDGLERIKAETGQGPFTALGVTFGDIRRMKPKELAALQLQIAEKLQRPREVVGNAFAA